MTGDPYQALLARKRVAFQARGFAPGPMPEAMRPHQADVTRFALEAGCAALFLDTGLGKTLCALEWGRQVAARTGRPVLLFAPLAVGEQHAAEAARFGYGARTVREQAQVRGDDEIVIANYERLHLFDVAAFGGVVLDESSILKSFTGKTTRALMEACVPVPYRLACTATPAPNDHMELGQHAQFLGVMDSNEMLSRWFISDQTQMGRYRLKRGAVAAFWDWVASWARCVSLPSDLGHEDAGYVLPPLDLRRHEVRADVGDDTGGLLFRIPDTSATAIHGEKRRTVADRAAKVAELVAAEPGEPWVVWCDTDYEADALTAAIPGALEVRGSMRAEVKTERLVAFGAGSARILVTKPSIAGFGLNWQHCARVAFVGLSFSYESFYQAVRRCWRFGQARPVVCHVVMADTERAIYATIARKRDDHDEMKAQMRAAMRRVARRSQVFESYGPLAPCPLPQRLEVA